MSASAVNATTARHDRPAGLVSLGRSLVINGLGPYLLYCLAVPHFPVASTAPLLLSAMVPAADLAIGFTRRRSLDVIAIIALSQLLVGVAIGLLTRSSGEALTGHALQPAALGLVFGLSVIAGKPLIEPLARQMIAGDDAERQARFEAKTALAGVRRIFVRLSLAWAVALIAESALLVTAMKLLAAQHYLLASSVINYATYGLLVWASLRYGRIKAAAEIS